MNHDSIKYCNNLFAYSRFKTREVAVGNIPMGAFNPIRIQSMTNTNTLDTKATVDQSIRLIQAGCEYVRISTPGIKEAENLKKIKRELNLKGYDNPIIADIHFNPAVAETAARIADKIRINPGNYIDKKNSPKSSFSEQEYNEELEKLYQKTAPLILICKEYGTAMRIGVNHGSLSDRIMNRYGDTPMGMVESALEFIRICEDLGFTNLVISMKASNIKIMVYAYRLLVHRMMKNQMNYPLHLGVTEAGSGHDGRIKSAAGIGSLLEDGIGDTLRVSLTEDPEKEIPVAKAIASHYASRTNHSYIQPVENISVNPFEYHKRISTDVIGIGALNPPIVITENEGTQGDFIFDTSKQKMVSVSDRLKVFEYIQGIDNGEFSLISNHPFFYEISTDSLTEETIENLRSNSCVIVVLTSDNIHWAADLRAAIFRLIHFGYKNPIIIKKTIESDENIELKIAADFAPLLVDGLCDGIWSSSGFIDLKRIEKISFSLLQATNSRITQTEYVSCPTCARTSFNIIDTVEKIKQYTSHLKGLKIAIMGCIVNGPGEMADAHYGYIGNGAGKINLYKGKILVKRNIEEDNALDELIKLLKENGDWVEEQ